MNEEIDCETTDICGLCGEPGADKIAKKMGGGCYWRGEQIPDGEFVHAECERAECERAFSQLTPKEIRETIDAIIRG